MGDAPQLLILGSLPSVASVEQQQYYGHPRNRFWPLMGALFQAGPELGYAQRVQKLTAQGVAVWDVLASSVRPGSLDSAIQRDTEVANPIAELLAANPTIKQVFFNGRAAQQGFARHIQADIDPGLITTALPSSSPANAAWSLPRLIEAWGVVRECCGQD